MTPKDLSQMARLFSSPVTAPLITAPASNEILPPSPVEAPSAVPHMRCLVTSYGSELCQPDPFEFLRGPQEHVTPPCAYSDNPHPGMGPCGFPGTGIPGFSPQYPLGTRWKMTKTGFVADIMKQCLQPSPLSKLNFVLEIGLNLIRFNYN